MNMQEDYDSIDNAIYLRVLFKRYRKEAKLSRHELAKRSGISHSMIEKYEHGVASVSFKNILKLYSFMGKMLAPIDKPSTILD